MSLSNAVKQLMSAASGIAPEPGDVQEAAARVVGEAESAAKSELDQALLTLAESIASAELSGAAVAAMCAGAIVQQGGDPNWALDAVLSRLPETLMHAQLYAEACEDAGDYADDENPVERFGDLVAPEMPANAAAFRAVEPLAMGAIAMLARSPVGRLKARQDYPNLADLSGDLAPFCDSAADLEEILRKV